MRVDECYQLGYIVKTHGLKGEVTIRMDVDNPEEYSEMESVFLKQNENLVPFFVSRILVQGIKAIAKFEGIDSLEDAKSIVGLGLYLPTAQLGDLPDGEFYYHELVGVTVYEEGTALGVISTIYQPSTQYIAGIEIDGKEVLIPIEDDIFIQVDLDKKRADVKLPDGLLDIYLNES